MIINKGKLVADGTPEELRKRSRGAELLRIRVEDGELNAIFQSLKQLQGVSQLEIDNDHFILQSDTNQSIARSIFKLCVDKGWVLTELTPVQTKLEDVFRELTMN